MKGSCGHPYLVVGASGLCDLWNCCWTRSGTTVQKRVRLGVRTSENMMTLCSGLHEIHVVVFVLMRSAMND